MRTAKIRNKEETTELGVCSTFRLHQDNPKTLIVRKSCRNEERVARQLLRKTTRQVSLGSENPRNVSYEHERGEKTTRQVSLGSENPRNVSFEHERGEKMKI